MAIKRLDPLLENVLLFFLKNEPFRRYEYLKRVIPSFLGSSGKKNYNFIEVKVNIQYNLFLLYFLKLQIYIINKKLPYYHIIMQDLAIKKYTQ